MKPEIKKIQLAQLLQFIQSDEYKKFRTVPISEARALSYVNNPHSQPNDVVLYMAIKGAQLVAFRTIFAGQAQSGATTLRFGWCSGNWVHTNYRRQGFSKLLLNEAYNDWDKKLAFTNYAPNSEQLYLQTGWFTAIHRFEGVRAYLFFKTRKLIPFSNKNLITKILFSTLDFFIAIFAQINCLITPGEEINGFRFEELEYPDAECYRSLEKQSTKFVFQRNEKELKWIFNYPWLSVSNPKSTQDYPFSNATNSFYYKIIKVFQDDNYRGFFMFSVREKHLKTLLYCELNEIEKQVYIFLKQYCKKNKIEMITVYKKELAEQFFKQKLPFLHRKRYGQKIYATFKPDSTVRLHYQDGDGDVFFT